MILYNKHDDVGESFVIVIWPLPGLPDKTSVQPLLCSCLKVCGLSSDLAHKIQDISQLLFS